LAMTPMLLHFHSKRIEALKYFTLDAGQSRNRDFIMIRGQIGVHHR